MENSDAAPIRDDERPRASIAVTDAGLSTRTQNLLRSQALYTLDDVALARPYLLALRNVGRKTLDEIDAAIDAQGQAPATGAPGTAGHAPERPALPARNADIVARRLAGASIAALAEAHELSSARIYQILKAGGTALREPSDEGSARRALRARNADIVAERLAGVSVDEIAEAHTLSHARVAQILKAAGVDGRAARKRRSDKHRADVEARGDDILQAFRRGDTPAQTAKVLQLNASEIREFLRTSVTPSDEAVRRGNRRRSTEPRYSDDDLVAAVDEVGQRYGRAPTIAEYQRAAAAGMLPSVPTITNRIGWLRAVALAGFDARQPMRPRRHRWTEQNCRQALRRLVVESGAVPTSPQYDALAQLDDALPSIATVRQRLGPWTKVTAEMARLPSRADVLRRVHQTGNPSALPDSSTIWMAYLEEDLSVEDMVVLLIAGDFIWDDEFGVPPPEFAEAVREPPR